MFRSLKFDFNKVSVAQDIATYHYTLTESMSDVALQKHIGFCNPDAPLYFTNSTIQQSINLKIFISKNTNSNTFY